MSNKYIVTNCPACYSILGKEKYICDLNGDKNCQDCTDCVMKQIVKKCRKSLEVSYCPIEQEILELLDIQKCE